MELIPVLHKFFQKTEEEETLLNSVYEANIILIPTPDKTRKGNCRRKSFMNIDVEILNRTASKLEPATYKRDYSSRLSRIYPRNLRSMRQIRGSLGIKPRLQQGLESGSRWVGGVGGTKGHSVYPFLGGAGSLSCVWGLRSCSLLFWPVKLQRSEVHKEFLARWDFRDKLISGRILQVGKTEDHRSRVTC